MALSALAIDTMLPALPLIGEALGISNENERQLVYVSMGALILICVLIAENGRLFSVNPPGKSSMRDADHPGPSPAGFVAAISGDAKWTERQSKLCMHLPEQSWRYAKPALEGLRKPGSRKQTDLCGDCL